MIIVLLLTGCIDSTSFEQYEHIVEEPEEIINIFEQEFNKLKKPFKLLIEDLIEIGIEGIKTIEDLAINEQILIENISNLRLLDNETIQKSTMYHEAADVINLIIHILNKEVGLDHYELEGTQTEYEQLSKAITEYTPLVGNYNRIVQSAKDYKNGDSKAKEEFYFAIAEFSLELILIQSAVFYKPAYKMTGFIYRNIGINRLAFKYPAIISFLLSKIHWYLRNSMVDISSNVASMTIQELKELEMLYYNHEIDQSTK
jgi:hypothetical protein